MQQTVQFSDAKNCLTAHSVSSAVCREMDAFAVSQESTHIESVSVSLAVGEVEEQGSDSDLRLLGVLEKLGCRL